MAKAPPQDEPQPEDKDELVLTPGGWRPKSKAHQVKPGEHVDGSGGRLKIIRTATGEVVEDVGETPPAEPEKPRQAGSRAGSRNKKKGARHGTQRV